jgi:hypothetical protein
MAETLLANPVIEDFVVTVDGVSQETPPPAPVEEEPSA